MTHGRKPRRVRFQPAVNTLQLATSRAAKFTPAERDEMQRCLRTALDALKAARCTPADWLELAISILIAEQIEKQGVVRGLGEHIASADQALTAVANRFNQPTGWRPAGLNFDELESIATFVGLHAYQVSSLAVKEYTAAYKAAISEGTRLGGTVGDHCRRLQASLAPRLRPGARQAPVVTA